MLKHIVNPQVGMTVQCVKNYNGHKYKGSIFEIISKSKILEDLTYLITLKNTKESFYVAHPHLLDNFWEVVDETQSDDIGEELSSLIAEAKKKHTDVYADVERANRRIKAVEECLNGIGFKVDYTASFVLSDVTDKYLPNRFSIRFSNGRLSVFCSRTDNSNARLKDTPTLLLSESALIRKIVSDKILDRFMSKAVEEAERFWSTTTIE